LDVLQDAVVRATFGGVEWELVERIHALRMLSLLSLGGLCLVAIKETLIEGNIALSIDINGSSSILAETAG
jgi:hypothetical protein